MGGRGRGRGVRGAMNNCRGPPGSNSNNVTAELSALRSDLASAKKDLVYYRRAFLELRAKYSVPGQKTEEPEEQYNDYHGCVAPSWRLNSVDRDSHLTISADGLSCEGTVTNLWSGGRVVGAVHTRGKYYYEATITGAGAAGVGLCRVGWATSQATMKIGTDDESFGFGGTGKKSHKYNFEVYGRSFSTGDVVGCFLDLDRMFVWWSLNGQEFPVAYFISSRFRQSFKALHPAVLIKNASLDLNLGQKPFRFPPGQDVLAVSQASEECVEWWRGH